MEIELPPLLNDPSKVMIYDWGKTIVENTSLAEGDYFLDESCRKWYLEESEFEKINKRGNEEDRKYLNRLINELMDKYPFLTYNQYCGVMMLETSMYYKNNI